MGRRRKLVFIAGMLTWPYASVALGLACEGRSLLCLLHGSEVRLRGPTLPMLTPQECKGTRMPLALGDRAAGSALSTGVYLTCHSC